MPLRLKVSGGGVEVEGFAYNWLVGNGRMVVIVVIIVPHSSKFEAEPGSEPGSLGESQEGPRAKLRRRLRIPLPQMENP